MGHYERVEAMGATAASELLTVGYLVQCEAQAGEPWPISGDATAIQRGEVQVPSVTEAQAKELFEETHNIFQVVQGIHDEVLFSSKELEEAVTKSEEINAQDISYGCYPSTAVNYITTRGEVIRVTAEYI